MDRQIKKRGKHSKINNKDNHHRYYFALVFRISYVKYDYNPLHALQVF